MIKRKEETGNRYDKLLVLKYSHSRSNKSHTARYVHWVCLCDCGKTVVVSGNNLRQKNTVSCGCGRNRPKSKKGIPGFKEVIRSYKRAARERNLSFNLTDEELEVFFKNNCFYCGNIPSNICKPSKSNFKEHTQFIYSGIDRLNNNLGYSTDNCVSCCRICNIMKSTLSLDNFYDHIEKILSRREK